MEFKKFLLVILVMIISLFGLMMGTSYAWYSFDNAKTTFNVVTNDDVIEVSYQGGEYINTSIAVPITSDQIDKYSDKSNFSVRVKNNKENNDVMVAIKLVDVVIDSQLRKSTFRVDLYYQGSQINSVKGTDIVIAVNENLGNVVLEDDVSNQVGNANGSLVLDLSMMSFDAVVSYDYMFYNFKAIGKIYVKNTSDQEWIVGKGFSNVTTSNVLVKS